MNYWRGSRVTTNFSSITDPPVLDGSTGKVHFFGISTGAGSPQVVQTDTALRSVVTATVGNANSPQVHAGTNHPTLYRILLASGVMSNTNDGNSLSLGTGKRPYQKPAFRHERVFETRALVCGKINGTQGACASNRKTS